MNVKSKTGTLKFKVASFRKIPNPYAKSNSEVEKKPEMYVLICDVLDVPEDIPMQTNPREQKLTTNVAKKIRESLTNHSERDFYLLNRGILISASNITYDNASGEVSLSFDDLAVHGNVDGGHTYKIIKECRKELQVGEQYCKIEVLTGVEDIFEQLAAARNTSVQVPDASIAELEKRFESLKSTFKDEPFSNDINYKQNDIKRIDIQDILTLLYLFNIDKYPTSSLTDFPISGYSGKKVCTDAYINVKKDGKFGYINQNGKIVIDFSFDFASPFVLINEYDKTFEVALVSENGSSYIKCRLSCCLSIIVCLNSNYFEYLFGISLKIHIYIL